MREFKFFRGNSGRLDMTNDDTRPTVSFNDDTDRNLYHRLNNPFNNNEMERYYYDHGLGRFETVRPTLNQEEVTRRINGGMSQEEILRRRHNFFEKERATTVNPKWWMKIKIVLQETWRVEPVGLVFISTMVTIITIIGIAKILNIW